MRGSWRVAGLSVAVVGTAAAAALALRADLTLPPESRAWYVAADLTAGLAFPAAAGVTVVAASGRRGPGRGVWWSTEANKPRLTTSDHATVISATLAAAVGVAWLVGSFVAVARPLHQSLLVLLLLAFPRPRVGDPARVVLATAAVAVAVVPVRQLTMAALFALVALATALRPAVRDGAARAFPSIAGAAVAATLVLLWWDGRRNFDAAHATVRFVAYAGVLVVVAVAGAVAHHANSRAGDRLADQLVGDGSLPGLTGLAAVLRHELGDPSLAIDQPGSVVADEGRRLVVTDGSVPVAVVRHASPLLDDAATADAVATAVRLVVTNGRLVDEQVQRLHDLETARTRLVAATDRERARMAALLRADVESPLAGAAAGVAVARRGVDAPEAADVLQIVIDELAAVETEIAGVVAGVPPSELGAGRLAAALSDLAARTPLPTRVHVEGEVASTAAVETALFYVCSEALTNAVKHADASAVDLRLRRDGARIELRVQDDGRGGADPAGSGLLGLADRLAAVGGRLRVDSPPGAGTVVVASLPA